MSLIWDGFYKQVLGICREYKDWLNTLGFSDSIVYNYDFHVRDLFEWLTEKGLDHIKHLTKKHLLDYCNYLQNRPNKRRTGGLSAAHLNKIFDSIDKLMEFLHQMGMDTAPSPPKQRIIADSQERVEKIKPFSQEEIKKLQTNIPKTFDHFSFERKERKQQQLNLIFALYYGCGLRRTEGMKLKISDVNFDSRTIFVHQGKNYKDRIVPMSSGVYTALQNYIYNFRSLQKLDHERLFINSVASLHNSLGDLQKLAENEQIRTKKLTFHVLRHSIATHLLQNGTSIENIAQFLGHGSLESTQIYTHIVERG